MNLTQLFVAEVIVYMNLTQLFVAVRKKPSLYRPVTTPQGSRRLELPDFQTVGT